MSRVFKASNVKMDDEKRFVVDSHSNHATKNNDEAAADTPEIDTAQEKDRILHKAESKASRIVADANTKAEEIIAEAREQAEMLKADAEQSARAEGYDVGYAQGVSEAEQLKVQAQAVYNSAVKERQKMFDDAEPFIMELVLKIVEKLMNKTAAASEQVIMNLIRQGLSETTITKDINIHVSAEDYDAVVENKQELMSLVSGGIDIEIIKDFSLLKSDCIIETPFGNIDCSLDQQFNALKADINYILENR